SDRPEHGFGRAARHAPRCRSRHGPEDRRLQNRARSLCVDRGARRDPRDRSGAPRAATRAGDTVNGAIRIPAPHLAAAGFCGGLSLALAARAPTTWPAAVSALLVAGALVAPGSRVVLVAIGLALAGWWLASARLAALDRSVLEQSAGEAAPVTVEVT